MFEQEYKRANDRIHPRKDLLKEMEARWAAEGEQPVEEAGKVVAFPAWVKFAGMAAGILLCVGLGMGSMMLLTRGRGERKASAAAEVPMMMDAMPAEEKAMIITESAAQADEAGEEAAAGLLMEAEMEAAPEEPPQGMHLAMDKAEVDNAVFFRGSDRGDADAILDGQMNLAEPAPTPQTPMAETGPTSTNAPTPAPKAAAAEPEDDRILYGTGKLLQRDDLVTVFLPTAEKVHVVRYASKKLTNVFSLSMREHGAQVKQFFWMGNEFLAVRERNGGTELLRFDVADWSSPRHLKNLTQSGTFLGAGEVDGRLVILSLYTAVEEEPLPWVNGERIDYTHVLLDGERPGSVFIVLTVYDPVQDGFIAETALLAECRGAVFGSDGLLLWGGEGDVDLYRFSCGEDGLSLTAQATMPGTVAAAAAAGEGYALLLQNGGDVSLTTLDGALNATAVAAADGVGPIRCAQVYEDGAFYMTADALHMLAAGQDRSLSIAGDGFRRLSADRLLVISATGQLHFVALDRWEALGVIEVKEDLSLLLADPSRLDYDPDTGRLVVPIGQKVYQYRIPPEGEFSVRSASLNFTDHDTAEQRELRCLLLADRALIFFKDGVILCNENLVRQATEKF